ncbi:MAG: N-acetylmuramoyl-L-alanine amidase [Pseudomonadota bacterium]
MQISAGNNGQASDSPVGATAPFRRISFGFGLINLSAKIAVHNKACTNHHVRQWDGWDARVKDDPGRWAGSAVRWVSALRTLLVLLLSAHAALVVGVQGATAARAQGEISATRAAFAAPEGITRFVLELSDEPAPRFFVVDGPPRLVMDLDGVAFDITAEVETAGVVSAWRYGALSGETGRIVFELSTPALIARHFFVAGREGRPDRLVVDLEPVQPDVFTSATRGAVAHKSASIKAEGAGDEMVVVLDPGHGGIDPGATSPGGIVEKDLALIFAQRLKGELDALPGVRAALTRTDDRFLPLNRRIRVARAYGADLFISIHADAAPQDYVQGATVYTLSERPSDAEAAALAARENLSDAVPGGVEPDAQEDVSGILADLLRRETKSFSNAFALDLVDSLKPTIRMNVSPHRFARFRVLMAHDIPSVLLELGYLTNEDDARVLMDPQWQAKAAAAVTKAVATFFGVGDTAQAGAYAEKLGSATRMQQ